MGISSRCIIEDKSNLFNSNKMIFCNVGWSVCYNGDSIYNGGSFVKEEGFGFEIYNFRNIKGKMYGYVRTHGNCDFARLGAEPTEDKISGLLVVFTATHKNGGTYIVGWYKNAEFYRSYQETRLKERWYKNKYLGYIAVTDSENAVLLPEHIRFSFPEIPRRKKGGMGTSNIWYADSPEMEPFKKRVLNYIEKYDIENIDNKTTLSMKRKIDIDKKKEVEKAAIDYVTNEYEKLGFQVRSVESENCGWDLEARFENILYKLEVKGLSRDTVSVELSENEYKKMQDNTEQYRLCIVCGCLSDKQTLYIFYYSKNMGWVDEDGNILKIEERKSAHCYL